jgi:hypothetical protein
MDRIQRFQNYDFKFLILFILSIHVNSSCRESASPLKPT